MQDDFSVDLTELKTWLSEIIDEAIMKRLESNASSSEPVASDHYSEDDASDYQIAVDLQRREQELARPIRTRSGGKKKVAKKARLVDTSGKAPRKTSTNNVFNRPQLLSAPLSHLLDGERELSRPQVVKRIWAYVKEHNLQDPKNKQIIVCDEKLRAVMKKDRIGCFAMNKVLSCHLSTKEETIEE